MNVLRWILVWPASFLCLVIGAMAARVVSRRIAIIKIFTGFLVGLLAVCIGGWLAPSHQTGTVITLAIINGWYSLSEARTVAFGTGQRVDWLFVSCALGGIVAAFNF